MNREAFDKAIAETPKGANIILEWRRPAKTYKTVKDIVEKATHMVGRIGIDYNNIATVQEKRENGDLPATPQPIWKGKGEWVTFPYLIRHVDKGDLYGRFYFGTSKYFTNTIVVWYLNGEEVPYEKVLPLLTADERKDDPPGETFTVRLEHILRIHQETDYMNVPAETTPVEVPVHPENIITI